MSNQWIDDLTVAQLKQELRDRDLKVSGNKPELLKRLREALAGEGSAGAAGEGATEKEKEKEKETTTRKKKSPGTPSTKASEFEAGTVKKGRGGGDYEVAVNKYGKKYWRKYTASKATTPTATATATATPEAVKEIEEWNKLVRKKMWQLKEMARDKDPDFEKTYGKLVKFQLIQFLLTGDPGPKPPKGISPKRKQVPVKPVPSKGKPKPSRKGKERADAEPEPDLEPEIRHVGEFKEVALGEWTALGELNVLFSFLKEVEDEEHLFKYIQDGIDNTPKEQVKGSENIIRFEPDPNCDLSSGTCGAQALGIFLESGVYRVSAEYTKANYLKALYVDFGSGSDSGKRSELPTLADFGLVNNLVLADLFTLKARVDRYDTVAELLEGMGGRGQVFDENFVLLSNPIKAKRAHIMEVKFVTRAEGVYNGLYVHRSTDRRRK